MFDIKEINGIINYSIKGHFLFHSIESTLNWLRKVRAKYTNLPFTGMSSCTCKPIGLIWGQKEAVRFCLQFFSKNQEGKKNSTDTEVRKLFRFVLKKHLVLGTTPSNATCNKNRNYFSLKASAWHNLVIRPDTRRQYTRPMTSTQLLPLDKWREQASLFPTMVFHHANSFCLMYSLTEPILDIYMVPYTVEGRVDANKTTMTQLLTWRSFFRISRKRFYCKTFLYHFPALNYQPYHQQRYILAENTCSFRHARALFKGQSVDRQWWKRNCLLICQLPLLGWEQFIQVPNSSSSSQRRPGMIRY